MHSGFKAESGRNLLSYGDNEYFLGLIYKLPLSVETKKAIGTIALKERRAPYQLYLSGFLTGIIC